MADKAFQSIPKINNTPKNTDAIARNMDLLLGVSGKGLYRALLMKDFVDNPGLGFKFNRSTGKLEVGNGSVSLATPSTPQNVVANGAFTNIIIQWDAPNFTGFAYAEVYRSVLDDFGTATRIATTLAPIHADPVGYAQDYFYWVRFVNTDDTQGPINATAGTLASTAPNISSVVASLSDEFNETHLAITLRSRLDLIDTPITGLVEQMTSANADITLLEVAIAGLAGDGGGYAAAIAALDASVIVNEGNISSNALAITALQSDVSDAEGNIAASAIAISILNTDVSTIDGALSSQSSLITTLQTTVAGQTSAISVHTSSLNGLEAQWDVKTQVGDLVGGVGFYNDGITTQFAVNAETFVVLAPDDSYVNPFFIQAGNTYIDTVMIATAAIQVAQIELLTVDDISGFNAAFVLATIGTAGITNAYIGNIIQSDDYVTGVSGWIIRKDGFSEFPGLLTNYIQTNDLNVVSTFMLQGQAVTIPVAAFTSVYVGVSSNTLPVTLQSLAFTSSGNSIHFNFSCALYATISNHLCRFAVVRTINGGSEVTLRQPTSLFGTQVFQNSEEEISISIVDSVPASGDVVQYEVRGFRGGITAPGMLVGHRSILCVEHKETGS